MERSKQQGQKHEMRLSGYDTFIFDLDGTLLHTLPDLMLITNTTLREMGWPERTEAEILQYVGNGPKRMIFQAVPEGTSDETAQQAFSKWQKIAKELDYNLAKPFPGMMETLAELRKRGCKLGVFSNKNDEGVREVLVKCMPGVFEVAHGEGGGLAGALAGNGLTSEFADNDSAGELADNELPCSCTGEAASDGLPCSRVDKIMDNGPTCRRADEAAGGGLPCKPDPAGILYVMRELGGVPERTAYVGDSPSDVLGAQNAGVLAVAVTWGYRTAEEFAAAGAHADLTIDSPLKLLDLV